VVTVSVVSDLARSVEACDIVMPTDRDVLTYEFTVD